MTLTLSCKLRRRSSALDESLTAIAKEGTSTVGPYDCFGSPLVREHEIVATTPSDRIVATIAAFTISTLRQIAWKSHAQLMKTGVYTSLRRLFAILTRTAPRLAVNERDGDFRPSKAIPGGHAHEGHLVAGSVHF